MTTSRQLFRADALDGDVVLKVGEEFDVVLEESPTTGFRWAVDALSEENLALISSDFHLTGDAAGDGGVRTMRFRTRGVGRGRLALKLWREWEGDGSVAKRLEVKIRVPGDEPDNEMEGSTESEVAPTAPDSPAEEMPRRGAIAPVEMPEADESAELGADAVDDETRAAFGFDEP